MLSRSVHLGYVFQPAAVNLTEAGNTLGDYFLGDMLVLIRNSARPILSQDL